MSGACNEVGNAPQSPKSTDLDHEWLRFIPLFAWPAMILDIAEEAPKSQQPSGFQAEIECVARPSKILYGPEGGSHLVPECANRRLGARFFGVTYRAFGVQWSAVVGRQHRRRDVRVHRNLNHMVDHDIHRVPEPGNEIDDRAQERLGMDPAPPPLSRGCARACRTGARGADVPWRTVRPP